MKAFNRKSEKQKLLNYYDQLRQEALNEIGIDVMRQTIAIVLTALRINKRCTDEELIEYFDDIVSWINTEELMGQQQRSDETTEWLVNKLNIDLERIKPKIGE